MHPLSHADPQGTLPAATAPGPAPGPPAYPAVATAGNTPFFPEMLQEAEGPALGGIGSVQTGQRGALRVWAGAPVQTLRELWEG